MDFRVDDYLSLHSKDCNGVSVVELSVARKAMRMVEDNLIDKAKRAYCTVHCGPGSVYSKCGKTHACNVQWMADLMSKVNL